MKQPGKTDQADRQLFEYAFHEGVPIAVLTDGQTGAFYLPAEQGSYEDRRFYKLDLLEWPPSESVEKLTRYLKFERIKSREALEDARQDYGSKSRRSQAKRVIPDAWKELVEAEDEMLFTLLSEAAEKRCGFKLESDDVAEFLNDMRSIRAPPTSVHIAHGPFGHPPVQPIWAGSSFTYNGRRQQVRSAKAVVIEILRALASDIPGFYEKCYGHPSNRGTSRTYIGRSPAELYTDRPDLQRQHIQLAPGWFLMTNFNNEVKEKIVRMACEVAGVRVGQEIQYEL